MRPVTPDPHIVAEVLAHVDRHGPLLCDTIVLACLTYAVREMNLATDAAARRRLMVRAVSVVEAERLLAEGVSARVRETVARLDRASTDETAGR